MTTDEQDKRIRDYLKGRLSGEERIAFESRLREDAILAERLELLRAEMAAAELLIAEDTRALFRQWEQAPDSPTGWLDRLRKFWPVAVGVLLATMLAVLWFQSRYSFSETTPEVMPVPAPPAQTPLQTPAPVAETPLEKPERRPSARPKAAPNYLALAEQYFQEPVLSNMRRAAADTVVSPLRLAQEAYSLGEYEKVLGLLAQVDSTRRQSAAFLSANALFHLQRFAEAEAQFQGLVEINSRQYRYQSEWGMLMCRLAQGNTRQDAFRQQVNSILLQEAHPYREKAKQLNDQLE